MWVISPAITRNVYWIKKEPPKLSHLRRFSFTVDKEVNVFKRDVIICSFLHCALREHSIKSEKAQTWLCAVCESLHFISDNTEQIPMKFGIMSPHCQLLGVINFSYAPCPIHPILNKRNLNETGTILKILHVYISWSKNVI